MNLCVGLFNQWCPKLIPALALAEKKGILILLFKRWQAIIDYHITPFEVFKDSDYTETMFGKIMKNWTINPT